MNIEYIESGNDNIDAWAILDNRYGHWDPWLDRPVEITEGVAAIIYLSGPICVGVHNDRHIVGVIVFHGCKTSDINEVVDAWRAVQASARVSAI